MNVSNLWQTPLPNLSLHPTELHLWLVDHVSCANQFSTFWGLLSPGEKERAAQFKFEHLRRRFVIAHGLQRTLAGRYTQRPPAHVHFDVNPYGKPHISDSDLRFNVSRTDRYFLFAFAFQRQVGVDIERIRPINNMRSLMSTALSDMEQDQFLQLPEHLRLRAFFSLWTRKEAFIKAVGTGLSFPLEDFSVSISPDGAGGLLSIRGDTQAAHDWCLHGVSAPEGWSAALAYKKPELIIKQWAYNFTFR